MPETLNELSSISFMNSKQAVDSLLFNTQEKLNFVTKGIPLTVSERIPQTLCIQFCNSQQNYWVMKPDRIDIFDSYDEAVSDFCYFLGGLSDE